MKGEERSRKLGGEVPVPGGKENLTGDCKIPVCRATVPSESENKITSEKKNTQEEGDSGSF